ncbi:secreted phosphoprotein 24 [Heterocephalus glaber]|uniref:Secreted phosphoprotein 24 n=1 Tax=Heterocephalus glaber TaxID=10181 RepID=A0AAX6Q5N7_HETGA|nr:secreted phosphoprotein 24 [Heterocephalus glaber]XP_004868424.1 secreted phosphoprotein 24 [Heterocephalus glaber]
MEKTVMKILIIFALGMNYWSCSGFPVFDYDPSSLHEALSASVAKVNSQLLSPYLFRAFRSSLKRVNALGEDSVIMSLEFSVRETTCLRGSVEDPSACAFQRGYYAQTAACRSTVQILGEQVQQVWAHCRWPDTSESSSSEEMILGDMERPYEFRNSYLLGLISEESRREKFYDRSLEPQRRGFPPANRRLPNYRHRARMRSGFE